MSILMAAYNYRKNKAIIYLSLFFFSVSTYSLIHYLLFNLHSKILIALFFSANIGFITYLPGLMLYFYTRSLLTDSSKLKRVDILHFIPIILIFISGIPNSFSTWESKLHIATEIINNNRVFISFYNQSTHGLVSFLAIFFSRPIYVFIYFVWSVIIVIKHWCKRKQVHILHHQKFMYSWLSTLFCVFFILIISHTILLNGYYFSDQASITTSFNTIQLIAFISLIGLLFSPFLFPSILYGLPQIKEITCIGQYEPGNSPLNDDTETHDQKEGKSEVERKERILEEAYLMSIHQLVESVMKNDQPFLDPDFNMAMLAVLIKIPVHHLTYYFKEFKNQTISDFRNYWRIEHAKKIIMEGKGENLTLEAIAKLSGFSSRNTFLVAFKKNEGITPKDFLNRNKDI